jgi:hypothetical protein
MFRNLNGALAMALKSLNASHILIPPHTEFPPGRISPIPRRLFSSTLLIKILCVFSPLPCVLRSYLILLDVITILIFGGEHKLLNTRSGRCEPIV